MEKLTLKQWCEVSKRQGLLDEWDAEQNAPLIPEQVLSQSHQKVWWQCENGHPWQATVLSRTHGNGCPYCANKAVAVGENDLASFKPELAAEWHPTKNGDLAAQWRPTLNGALTPDQVTKGSCKKVWWQYEFGHMWQAVVFSRTGQKRSGCPVCSGRVKQKTVLIQSLVKPSQVEEPKCNPRCLKILYQTTQTFAGIDPGCDSA